MITTTVPKQFTREVRALIIQMLGEILSDPDLGLELTAKARKRLRGARTLKKTVPFADIKKRYSLKMTRWALSFSEQAENDLARLSVPVRRRVLEKTGLIVATKFIRRNKMENQMRTCQNDDE